MSLLHWIADKIFGRSSDKNSLPPANGLNINFKVLVIEFADNVESNSGETIAQLMTGKEGLQVTYFNEPFSKHFLNLESLTLFDLIDKGQALLERTGSDILLWGYREADKIRLNFQTAKQYEEQDNSFVSLLDCLYIPATLANNHQNFPDALSNLIYGALISAVNLSGKEAKIQKKYLLRKIIDKLTRDNSAKNLSIEYIPYIMNFLGIIYLSYAHDNGNEKDFKIVKNLFEAAIGHQDLIKNPIHLGCIYYHLGQLYDTASQHMQRKPLSYYRGAIENYRQAQKYLNKYSYPYDYGYISYKLSDLFYNYWRQKDDLQALRDAVFQLRESEKIYTYALFPDFWAHIQGKLGYLLSMLGSITKSESISELAITAYQNQQKVITERREPLEWARIQERIGDICYRLGKAADDKDLLEEALEYYHDALYIYENMELTEDAKKLTISIAKTSQHLNRL